MMTSENGGFVLVKGEIKKEGTILGVLGIMNIVGENYLAVISEA